MNEKLEGRKRCKDRAWIEASQRGEAQSGMNHRARLISVEDEDHCKERIPWAGLGVYVKHIRLVGRGRRLVERMSRGIIQHGGSA
jgi:hypothetical protein